MKEIEAIINAYQNRATGERMALATVVRVEGSSYRRPGARMLVSEHGHWVGGISGGCLEGDALRKAQLVIFKGQPSVVTYDTTEEDAHQIGVGLGCNGVIDVLIAPIGDRSENVLQVLARYTDQRQPHIIVTVVDTAETLGVRAGTIWAYEADEPLPTSVPTEHQTALKRDIARVWATERALLVTYALENGSVRYFIEHLPPVLQLYLMGGNYDVAPLAQLAKNVGYRVYVVANPRRLPAELLELVDGVCSAEGELAIDPHTACLLMAHDYKTDKGHLRMLLDTDVPYIGMLGPRKRTDKILAELGDEGLSLSAFDRKRLYAPVGLDIGATSPEEIGLSILSEVRAHFARRKGGFLRDRKGTIHERTSKTTL